MASEPKPIEKIMKLGYVKQIENRKNFSHRNGSEEKKSKTFDTIWSNKGKYSEKYT